MKQRLITVDQLGQILVSARRAKGLNQTEAGRRIGISQARLSAMELNPATIRVDQLLTMMAAYGLEIHLQTRPDPASLTGAEW